MSDWIKCGLPWNKWIESKVPEMDWGALDKRAKEKFGKTIYESRNAFTKKEHEEFEDIRDQCDQNNTELASLVATNDLVKRKLEHFAFTKIYDEWSRTQPEMIEWGKKCQAVDVKRRAKEAKTSFHGANLNKPGTIIEFEKDGKIVHKLIGDMNCLGGVCDDCRGIQDETIILRYRTIKY